MPTTPKAKPPGNGGGTAKTYRYIGDHAQILEQGNPLGHGEYVDLADEDITGINKMLMDEGKLIDATDVQPSEKEESE